MNRYSWHSRWSVWGAMFTALIMGVLFAACSGSSITEDSSIRSAEPSFDAAKIRADIEFLSDDALGGRGPATLGDTVTRNYIATRLLGLGYEPLFENQSWEQFFEIISVTTEVPNRWTIQGPSGSETLTFHEDFIANGSNQARQASLANEEWVFVGYGIQAPEYDWDDYKGADVRGKVLVMLNNDPDWDPELFQGTTRQYYGRWTYKYEMARALGAKGAVIVHTTPSAGYGWEVIQSSWTGPQFEVPKVADESDQFEVSAWITEDKAKAVWTLAGRSWEEDVQAARSESFAPIPLGLSAPLKLKNDLSWEETANVGGILRGSDPELKNTYVIYTAHHDHIGTIESAPGEDAIYNGALDNATGVAQTLAVAEAFANFDEHPKRSIVILAVGAEEQGLLGSKYFAQNPPMHPGSIAANLNIDGGNIWGETEDIALIGMGKSSMDEIAREAAAEQGREVVQEAFPDRGYYYRSDQFNFAKIGVPALYTDTGTRFVDRPEGWAKEQIEAWEKSNYHQPSDEFDESWSFDGILQDVEFMYLAGRIVANSEDMPTWNPGDEFEEVRKQALEDWGAAESEEEKDSP